MAGTDDAMSALDKAQEAVNSVQSLPTQWMQPWSTELVKFLVIGVLGFCCFALVMASVLLWRSAANAPQILRVFGIITILGFSALLLVTGYSNEQLTPIVGLFGAIAGYLLGKDIKQNQDE